MNEIDWLDQFKEEYEDDPEYLSEKLFLETTEKILSVMDYKGISKADLAKRMDVSRAYISKLFNNSTNLTLTSLAKISIALGIRIGISVGTGGPQLFKINSENSRKHRRAKEGTQPDLNKISEKNMERENESQTCTVAA